MGAAPGFSWALFGHSRLVRPELSPGRGYFAPRSCFRRHQVVHPDQIVGRKGKQKQGVDRRLASDLDLPQTPGQFDPSEDLLNAFSTSDADGIFRCRGDLIGHCRAAMGVLVLGHMRCRCEIRKLLDEIIGVVALVRGQGDLVAPFFAVDHSQCRAGLAAVSTCPAYLALHHQAASILHHGIAQETRFGRGVIGLAGQSGIRIRLGTMRIVGKLLAFEIPDHILALRRSHGRFVLAFGIRNDGLVTLDARPCLQERAVHAEVLFGYKAFGASLLHDLGQETAGYCRRQKSVA